MFARRISFRLGLAFGALVVVLAVNVGLIVSARRSEGPRVEMPQPTPTGSATTAPESFDPPPLVAKHAAPEEPSPVADSSAEPPKAESRYRTVFDAADRSCSTSTVDGLSRQIISPSRCVDAGAVVPLPTRANLIAAPHVFLYFDKAARDELVAVLDEHPKRTMTINSALRTVAQQYMVRRWAAQKRCGVQMATPPGESNHESGLALDIREVKLWRRSLEEHGFRWLGSKDRVHFDYKREPASTHTNADVTAFQQLWNRNHPEDPIADNGRYTAATEERLKKAPPNGFALGADCRKTDAVSRGGGGSSRARGR
ncbi:MAG: hypothetical protein HOV80_28570 [Polyangiaceae bacterium]|nr:hypothetical protein [Polyangiaceae bacterium]